MWLCCSKNPLRVSVELLIFLSHDTTRTINVLLLRFGCQKADHFVGLCGFAINYIHVHGMGIGAKIRLCAIVLDFEQGGADFRSILQGMY